ncbi:MAG: pilus assembly protein TadG-related protein [Actinobacteria bacterium]|nr:pilus assembly protein TadG-related protein [Actinomycetota bacterium]MCL6088201.1 pilus assembly protein TadG-related protein [Actinomycetota bacterium]
MPVKNNIKKLNLQKFIIFKNIFSQQIRSSSRGNISIILGVLVLMFAVLFVSIFDIFQLYIAREHTKNASDAATLAAAQNLLFFEQEKILEIANEISRKNDCDLQLIEFNYDEIVVRTFKKVNFIFIGRILKNNCTVYSTSRIKVTYPWDVKFNNCKSFRFEF